MDVIKRQMEVITDQFNRNNIEIIYGEASFIDEHRLAVKGARGSEELSGSVIIIATGTRPLRPADVPFDEEHIYDTDTILKLNNIPAFLTIIGGGVIGFPALASTSMEQGRRAVCNAFHREEITCEVVANIPFGIYTIPEISMVGATEEELTKKGISYETGCAFFHEVAKGQIIGDTHGMLKLIFDREDRRLLGVHIIGEKATDLIHIGQAVMGFGGTIDYFKDTVFNYPTLSDAYKDAALNGLNKL